MSTSPVRDQLIRQLEHMTAEQQKQLLDYAMRLQGDLPPGIRGEELIALAHDIDFPPDDLAEIVQAIEDDCERIDWNGWQ